LATLLLHHSCFANHKTSAGHPERPDRYRVVEAVLGQPQFDALVREEAEVADLDATRYVHSNRYVDALEAARPDEGYVYLDGGDTMMEPSPWEVVLRGAANETGVGNIFNSPLAAGDGGTELRDAFEDRILPAVDAFSPELIIVSAGFDAHVRDPLGSLRMTADDFAWVTRELMKSAEKNCQGRLVAVLEGGYDLQGLADSVSAHVGELIKG
jgi:acetoin utilization deacetylase AcuC-like enzyme